MDVCRECCVLSDRGICDGLITRPEESYRLWRIVVCNQETSKTRMLKPATGLWKIQPQWVVTPGKQTTNKHRNMYCTHVRISWHTVFSECGVLVVNWGCVECLELPFGNVVDTDMLFSGCSGRQCSFSASGSHPGYIIYKQCHLVHIPHSWLAYCLYATNFQ
jgi:hypothetical protein